MITESFCPQTPLPSYETNRAWEEDFKRFHARFAPLFSRSEPREQARKYLRGLLGPVERRNGWQLAEVMGDQRPDAMQRLLYKARWDVDQAQDLLLAFQAEQLGDPEGIAIFDETSVGKKGTKSVGVARQYSSAAGKVDNCQVTVLMSYRSPRGYGLLDRRLYLPQAWCDDEARREEAQIPSQVPFCTKPQLATQMLTHALAQGLPMRWITGDEVYGDDTGFRQAIAAQGLFYVLAVASSTPVWTVRPVLEVPTPVPGRPGRRAKHPRLAAGQPGRCPVSAVVAALPSTAWTRLAVSQGEKGPIEYDWAMVPVVESHHRVPGPDARLLVRRSNSDPTELAYYLSNAPKEYGLENLARVAAQRFTVEQCIQEAKDDTGMDQYEVRSWQSWHRHMTLTLMALAWLGSVRRRAEGSKSSISDLAPLTVTKVRRLLVITLPLPPYSKALHLAWSLWRRRRRTQARRSHYQRRARLNRDPLDLIH